MAKKIIKEGAVVKERKTTPLLEDPNALLDRLTAKDSLLVRYRNPLLIALGLVVAAIAALVGYRFYLNSQDNDAQPYLFPAVNYFEADSLQKALQGDGTNDGFTTLADGEYGATKTGNLANFYAGVAYLKDGKFDDAIQRLKDFSSSDLLLQARAYALIGDAYLEKKAVKEAIEYYQKAANYKPNKHFTPTYLMKLAIAYEADKNYTAAIGTYDEIVEKYFDSPEAPNARKYKSRAEGLAGN
ncbi:MAG: tetratricopeptide repeat protein [Ferruginibacter sp.]|nr:tetratricopeptide repeat protein [Cytophagales bacterium]